MKKEKKKDKSVLDEVGVDDTCFPLSGPRNILPITGNERIEVVSGCPACGAPIYGPVVLRHGLTSPYVIYTCECRKAEPEEPAQAR